MTQTKKRCLAATFLFCLSPVSPFAAPVKRAYAKAVKDTKAAKAAEKISETFRHAVKWGQVFGIPPSWIMAIAAVESQHEPLKVNMRKAGKGGAWGLMGQMADEAAYKISIISRFYRSSTDVRRVLTRWTGDPSSLLDPELNMMLGAWQLRRLATVFGFDFTVVAAAYHQGAGAIRRRLARGEVIVSPQHPQGTIFLARAETELEAYERYVTERQAGCQRMKSRNPPPACWQN